MSGSGRESCRMSGSGRKANMNVWEWSRGLSECPGVVGRLSRMFGSGREAFPDVREWSGGHPGYLAVVKRPLWMSGSA